MNYQLSITKDEINELPLYRFQGKIRLVNSKNEAIWAAESLKNEKVLGFDTETKPTFVKGPLNPPSILQLACIDKVYIFQLDNKSLYKKLFPVLSNENITKCGVSVDRDLIELMYLSPFDPLSFVDLGNVARDYDVPHHGLRGLVAMFLKHRISKGAQISDWSKTVLSPSQITYAATDAWISLKLFEAFEQNDLL